jgi:hypothetical protein
MGRFEEALDIGKKLLSSDSDNAQYQSFVTIALNNIGLVNNNMGKFRDKNKERNQV